MAEEHQRGPAECACKEGRGVTRSELLIAKVRKKLYAKEQIPIVEELIAEYEIAIAQNLRLETALHERLKDETT